MPEVGTYFGIRRMSRPGGLVTPIVGERCEP